MLTCRVEPLEEIADPLELVERTAGRNDEHLVKAQLIDPFQPYSRFIRRAHQRDRRPFGEAARFGSVAEVDKDVGEDCVLAAGLAIEAHPGLEILPTAVETRGDPASAFLGG